MCVTGEVPVGFGLLKVKGTETSTDLSAFTEGSSQYLPGQRRDVSYISRIQCRISHHL